MKISEGAGARVHASKGKNGVVWRVNYKTEGVWCNSEDELVKVLKQVSMVQLHGESFKTWRIGKDGWNMNADHPDKKKEVKEKVEKISKKEKKKRVEESVTINPENIGVAP